MKCFSSLVTTFLICELYVKILLLFFGQNAIFSQRIDELDSLVYNDFDFKNLLPKFVFFHRNEETK